MSPLESLVAALLHSLWQGGAAFLFVAAALWIVPARKAQLRYTLCLAALAGTLLSCVATWAVLDVKASVQARMRQNVASGVSLSGRAELPLAAMDGGRGGNGGFSAAIPRASSASRAAEVPKPTAQYLYLPMLRFPAIGMREWTGRIAAAWLCGVALFLIRMARGLLGADRLRNDAREVTSPQFLGMARELIREMGLERQLAAARFLVSTHVSIPAVIGFVRPSVLIPASMLLGVPQDYLRAVLAHEFAHIARWDYLVNIGQMLIEALLFFNPFVWWISRQIRREREACCDELAAACCETGAFYLEALIACASNAGGDQLLSTAALAANGGEKTLVDRAKRLLYSGYRPVLRVQWLSLAGIFALGGLALSGMIAGAHATAEILTPQEKINRINDLQKQYGAAIVDEEARNGGMFMMSGKIITDDGKSLPEEQEVQVMHSRNRDFAGGMKGKMKHFPDGKFELPIFKGGPYQRGIPIYVGVWVAGRAPAFIGPLSADKDFEDLRFVVTKGLDTAIHVAAEDGKPVEGAQIEGFYEGPPQIGKISGTTSLEGNAPIHGAGTGEVDLEVTAKGFFPAHLIGVHFGAQPLRCVLKRGYPVTGRVIASETGQALPDAKIMLRGIDGPYKQSYGPDAAPVLATSNSQGEFSLDGLAEDSTYYFLVKAGDRRSLVTREPGTGSAPLNIALDPAIAISGKVLVSNTAQTAVTVCCQQSFQFGRGGQGSRPTETTVPVRDGAAHFSFSALYPTNTTIWVTGAAGQAREFMSLSQSIDDLIIGADSNAVPARDVIIRFDLPKNAPLPTGTMVVFYDDQVPWQPHEIPLENGEARVRVTVPNSLTLRPQGLVGYSFEEKAASVVTGSGAEEIHLDPFPAGAVYGTLTGAHETERRRPGVQVERVNPPGNARFGLMVKVDTSKDVKSDTYRFIATPLPFGADYVAVARSDDGSVESAPFHIDGKTPIQNIRIEMPKGITVRRRFVDSDGKPIVGMELTLFYSGTSGVKNNTGCGPTDANGWLSVSHLIPGAGDYRLQNFKCKSLYVPEQWPLDLTQPEQEFRVRKGKVLSGVALDAVSGKPVEGIFIEARLANASTQKGGSRVVASFDAEEATDAGGHFRFSNLPDGDLTVWVDCWGFTNAGKPETAHSGQVEPVTLGVKPDPPARVPARSISEPPFLKVTGS
jgi:beta-lactamase regulating signal transducer with metallopeptidase domain